MRLLLDEGVARRTASLLRDRGIDTAHLFDLELGGATDATILDQAADQHATIVTLDSDFHQLLALTGAQRPSVIRIRKLPLGQAT